MNDTDNLTSELNAAFAGDPAATAAVMARVYGELKHVARSILRNGSPTISATALVHDLFLKLVPGADREFVDRKHFFSLAARAMRQIVIDHVRAQASERNGGGLERTDLSDRLPMPDGNPVDLLALDSALARLQVRDIELAEITEAYFFAGFTFSEIAEVRGTSERSVRRQWEVARLFLLRELG